jgi:hypothetical protein
MLKALANSIWRTAFEASASRALLSVGPIPSVPSRVFDSPLNKTDDKHILSHFCHVHCSKAPNGMAMPLRSVTR